MRSKITVTLLCFSMIYPLFAFDVFSAFGEDEKKMSETICNQVVLLEDMKIFDSSGKIGVLKKGTELNLVLDPLCDGYERYAVFVNIPTDYEDKLMVKETENGRVEINPYSVRFAND